MNHGMRMTTLLSPLMMSFFVNRWLLAWNQWKNQFSTLVCSCEQAISVFLCTVHWFFLSVCQIRLDRRLLPRACAQSDAYTITHDPNIPDSLHIQVEWILSSPPYSTNTASLLFTYLPNFYACRLPLRVFPCRFTASVLERLWNCRWTLKWSVVQNSSISASGKQTSSWWVALSGHFELLVKFSQHNQVPQCMLPLSYSIKFHRFMMFLLVPLIIGSWLQ